MRNMKDSGVEWIGEIPEEWETIKSKYLFEVVNGATPSSGNPNYWNGEIMWITPADYATEDKYIENSNNAITEEGLNSCGTTLVSAGSIIISNRAPIGSVGIAKQKLCTNQGCKALVKNVDVSSLYYYYYFSVMNGPLNLLGKGTTFLELSSSELKNFIVPYPKHEVQKNIGGYLEKRCAEIDSVIMAKETTNSKLKEYRQSVIYEAVTKGLDKNVPMKDSGIEWIGEIPEGWETIKTKCLFEVVNGATPSSGNPNFWDGKIIWITPADYATEDKYIMHSNNTITEEGLCSCGTTLVPPDSIIISNRAPIGSVVIAKERLCTNQGCKALVKNKNVSSLYYYYFFSIMNEPLNMLGKGTTFMELSSSELKKFLLPYPKYEIQKDIVNYLDKKCAEIDLVISANETTIQKLKEYRQSVIYEVVTGKIEI